MEENSPVTSTASTFIENANIMGKVYFPRLTVPISSVMFAAINMLIVFAMTIVTIIVYVLLGISVHPHWTVVLIPLYMMQTAALGLGVGIIVSSLTTKYRDLVKLVSLLLAVWRYFSPVAYHSSSISLICFSNFSDALINLSFMFFPPFIRNS